MLLKTANLELKLWLLFSLTSYRFDVQSQTALIFFSCLYAFMTWLLKCQCHAVKPWIKPLCKDSNDRNWFASLLLCRPLMHVLWWVGMSWNLIFLVIFFYFGLSHGLLNSRPLLLLENSWPVGSNILGWMSANLSLTFVPCFSFVLIYCF